MFDIFITGLKRQTGKTLISCAIAGTMQSLGYSCAYYKPIQTDTQEVNGFGYEKDTKIISEMDSNIKTLTTYALTSSSSPLVAAYEGSIKELHLSKIVQDFNDGVKTYECCVVEGANSISSPIDEDSTEADIPKAINFPVLFVVNPKHSKLEDIISSVNYAQTCRVDISGVILNEYDKNSSNIEEKYITPLIEKYTNVKVLGSFPHYDEIDNINPSTLIADTLNRVDLESVFGLKISKL